MKILYTCDNNYVWIMGISMISLFKNNTNVKELEVYLLGENIDEKNKEKLYSIAKDFKRKIYIIDANIENFNLKNDFIKSSRWPISAFSRLYSALLLPKEISKIMYIDCDTIIKESLIDLDKEEFENNIFLGVKECVSKGYKKNIGLADNDNYINAGILLIDLEKLRNIDINKEIQEFVKKYKNKISYADQDVLNGIFHKKIGILSPKFNVMTIEISRKYKDIIVLRKPSNFYSETEIEEAIKKPYIIHYTTNLDIVRPWFSNSNHPFLNDFLEYYNMSPWKDREFKPYKFNSKQDKIVSIVQKIPFVISKHILGLIYTVRPAIVRITSKFKKSN